MLSPSSESSQEQILYHSLLRSNTEWFQAPFEKRVFFSNTITTNAKLERARSATRRNAHHELITPTTELPSM